jgi:hypothetical protein
MLIDIEKVTLYINMMELTIVWLEPLYYGCSILYRYGYSQIYSHALYINKYKHN